MVRPPNAPEQPLSSQLTLPYTAILPTRTQTIILPPSLPPLATYTQRLVAPRHSKFNGIVKLVRKDDLHMRVGLEMHGGFVVV
jgi:hypothetical protein